MYIHANKHDVKNSWFNVWFNTSRAYILAKRRNPDIKLISFSKEQHFKCVDHKAIFNDLRKLDSKKLNSYYTDQYGHTVFNAFVLRLNHERGFVPGFYLEGSDCYTVDYSYVWDEEDYAVNEANRLALRAAEDEQQFQIEQRAFEIIEELKQDLKVERTSTLKALKGAPRKARERLLTQWLEWRADKHQGIKELTDKPYMSLEWSY